MNVTAAAGHNASKTQFLLIAGEPVSQDLIEALDTHNTVELVRMVRSPNPDGMGWHNTGAMLCVDRRSPAALEADAGRQALSTLRQLFRLGLGQPADDGLAPAAPALPQAQEQLAASLVQLQGVVNSLVIQIGEMEFVLKKMQCAHTTSSETATVVQEEPSADYCYGKHDAMYDQAVELVRTDRKASISYVQRKLRIDYNRTARILEAMEKDGIVSPMTKVGGREVIA